MREKRAGGQYRGRPGEHEEEVSAVGLGGGKAPDDAQEGSQWTLP